MRLSNLLENKDNTKKETEELIGFLDNYNAKTKNQKISNGINMLIGSLTDTLQSKELNEKIIYIGNDDKRDARIAEYKKNGKVKSLTYNFEALIQLSRKYKIYPTKDKTQMDIIIDSLDEIKELMELYKLEEI